MDILKNFKIVDGSWEEFPFVKILPGEDVFVDLPLCRVGFQVKFTQPVLLLQENQIPTIIELEELKHRLTNTKVFYFKNTDELGHVCETSKEEAKIAVRLPKDTKIEELIIKDGMILKEETIE